jgi:restriction system protein
MKDKMNVPENSAGCAAKCLYAVMQHMKKNGGSVATKEINQVILKNVELSEWEKEYAGKTKTLRWWKTTQFYSIDYVKAGFIVKKNSCWYLTPEGETAMKQGAWGTLQQAVEAYRAWRATKNELEGKNSDEDEKDEEEAKEKISTIEELEEKALDGIREYINHQNAYDFQDDVAALLRAMDYHVPYVAPPGPDGGIDIIAHIDALGAKTPRIKVQVKHKPNNPISNTEINSLSGLLRAGDIGLFVTSGSFSKQAVNAAQTANTYIKLIDGKDFIKLWREYYSKMSDEDKNRIPLKFIAFIGSND